MLWQCKNFGPQYLFCLLSFLLCIIGVECFNYWWKEGGYKEMSLTQVFCIISKVCSVRVIGLPCRVERWPLVELLLPADNVWCVMESHLTF